MSDEHPTHEAADEEPVTSAREVGRVIRFALLTALLLNTAGFIRAGLGMTGGPARTVLLDVGRPLDAVARTLDLDKPRRSLDAMLGHPDEQLGDPGRTRLEQDSAKAPPAAVEAPSATAAGAGGSGGKGAASEAVEPRTAPVAESVRHVGEADPLRVLVTGDSLSDFDGQQLVKIITAQGLPAKVRNEPRNGTGLTQPNVFDWADEAANDAVNYNPDVVVMVLGANDGWPLVVDGRQTAVGSSAWVGEYTRRVEAVTRDFLAGDPQRRVYWVGPPVPRSSPWIHIFDRINAAVRDAVPLTPGLRYVDVAGPTSANGVYTDYLQDPGGARVLARQRDGIHFSYPGSVFPARLILAALETEFTLR
jgi:hypothetical protein